MSIVRVYGGVTRRQTIFGGASAFAIIGSGNQATAYWPWLATVAAGVASGWLVKALENWDLISRPQISATVNQDHYEKAASLQGQGYDLEPLFRGSYRGGDYLLSQGTRGQDFTALSTADHGATICTQRWDNLAAINLGLSSDAMRQAGLTKDRIQAATLPIHPLGTGGQEGSVKFSTAYLTPSHGQIAWSTDLSNPSPNCATSIRGDLNADIRCDMRSDGLWYHRTTWV